MIEKTVRILADEIGVSKQRIQQIIDKLPDNQKPTKRGNRYVLSEIDIINIKIEMGLLDPTATNIDKYRQISTIKNILDQQIPENIDNKSQAEQQISTNIDNKEQKTTKEDKESELNSEFDIVFDFLKKEIGEKNNQIKEKDKQIAQIQKLLENQQILTLQAQEKIKLLEESKTEEEDPLSTETFQQEQTKKQGFFSKWFK
ncbi:MULTISPECIES: DUF536 domain-containing protein [unclassified Lactococcus]|uniref:DUF536 domain-containing protein n=1 Tax=unclassified Lactococcus TaxID=2643510 RepID=UPI0011C8319F|nr:MULTISPECIES: DUF536 domain-containing protein [unclassified Lactococcus]MQW23400.1 DUF536 domain-containing protein [Lactococcus sp. dk101]TXK36440.1 DUF536 domain-containing protein [Lactococcus sp. dk310]TXK45822.1 DUF536 domain-containing protein [Lactococcus sp. dk322]